MDEEQGLTYERLLGEGAYGKVFLVKQDDGEKYAVKEIDLDKCDEIGRKQALREAELLSRLSHPNILKYIESMVNDDCLYIVTEYCQGGDVEEYLQTCASKGICIPESLASEWLYQMGGALAYLHEEKILHRDMKTKNLFLKTDLTLKLGDLGIAKVLDLNQSKADTFIGTPAYMSPELFMGQPYNHKTDIWGLGCCAYEVLTFRRAFEGRALWTIIKQIKEGKELELPETYSLDLRTLVLEMISQQPEDRPSASEIISNPYLQYHKGRAEEDVRNLPVPDVERQKKSESKKRSGSSGSSGKMSSSMKSLLESKRKNEEDTFRQSIAGVIEKLNTLRLSHQSGTVSDTFIYHGDDDEDEGGETLDAVDTFIYHGEDEQEGVLSNTLKVKKSTVPDVESDDDSDSDYSTERTLQTTIASAESSLLEQYTSQLETMEHDVGGAGEEEDEEDEEDSGRGSSPVWPDHVEKMLIRKPPKKLKDTFEVRELKKSRVQARNRFRKMMEANPGDILEEADDDVPSGVQNGSVKKTNSKLKDGMSLSASFSAYDTSKSSPDKKSRLTKTLSFEEPSPRTEARAKRRERQANMASSMQQPKDAFINLSDGTDRHLEKTDISVSDVMQHLRSNLSPQMEEDSDSNKEDDTSETIKAKPLTPTTSKQEPVVRKKKDGVLKKYSARSSVDSKLSAKPKEAPVRASVDGVRLFTRAQAVSFSNKDDEEEEELLEVTYRDAYESHKLLKSDKKSSRDELRAIASKITKNAENTITTEQILNIKRELANGIGAKNMETAMKSINMLMDQNEMKAHLKSIVGPKLYEEYQDHFVIMRMLEIKKSASQRR